MLPRIDLEQPNRHEAFIMKKALILVAIFSLFVGIIPSNYASAANDSASDEQWPHPNISEPGYQAALFEDHSLTPHARNSWLYAHTGNSVDNCLNMDDSLCQNAEFVGFNSILGPCETDTQLDCIEGLTATKNGSSSSGEFSYFYPEQGDAQFVGSTAKKIPSGLTTSVWKIPSAPHQFGDEYMVLASVSGSAPNSEVAKISGLTLRIIPVSFMEDAIGNAQGVLVDTLLKRVNTNGDVSPTWATPATDFGFFRCVAWELDGSCALQQPFPNDTSFTLKARLSLTPKAWMHGRMTNPVIDLDDLGDGASRVSVSASPIKVPTVFGGDFWDDLPLDIRNAYKPGGTYCQPYCGGRINWGSKAIPTDPHLLNSWSYPESNKDSSFNELRLWLPVVGDTAVATPSVWSARTLGLGEMVDADTCFLSGAGIKGIVTSNATVYGAGPPEFNNAEGTLNYKVAAPHFNPDGSVFKGTYDITMTSDVARCVYQLGEAPINVNVRVIGENGLQTGASTTATEVDGWLRISVKDFTFSSPPIKLRITQKKGFKKPKAPQKVVCLKGGKKKAATGKCPPGAETVSALKTATAAKKASR